MEMRFTMTATRGFVAFNLMLRILRPVCLVFDDILTPIRTAKVNRGEIPRALYTAHLCQLIDVTRLQSKLQIPRKRRRQIQTGLFLTRRQWRYMHPGNDRKMIGNNCRRPIRGLPGALP